MHYGWGVRLADFLMFVWIFLTLTVGYGPKRSRKSCVIQGVCYALLGSGCILLQEALYPSYSIYQMLFFLMGALYSLTALGGQTGPKLTTLILYCAAAYLCGDVCSWLFPLPAPAGHIFTQAIHVILMLLVSRRSLKSTRKIPPLYWLPMMMICLLIACWVLLPWDREIARSLAGRTSLFMLLIVIISYFLASRLVRDYERNLVQISLRGKEDGETALETENARLNEALRRERHEQKNHLATLSALLGQERIQEARALLEELNRPTEECRRRSGNAVIDAVLSHYSALAAQRHIAFSQEACLDTALPVSDADLSSLLNNLLSNAFEASAQVEQPDVQIRVFPAKDYLCIFVRNKADGQQLKANPLFHTTKKNPEIHGIGLQIVRELAEKYHGWTEITAQDDSFAIQVMLLVAEN